MLTIRELIRTLYNAFNQKLKNHRGNWEQNDSTADDYIKNRPFYTDGYTTIIKEITFTTPESYYWCSPFVFELKEGEIYNVTWNGKEHECVVKLEGESAYIGNLNMVGGSVNTGEPFFFFYSDYGDGDIEYALIVKNSGTHTVSVNKQNVVKINSKYLDIQIPEVPEGASIGIKGTGENAEVFNGGRADWASGAYSHSEGTWAKASGWYAHAEGANTTASGEASHVEGSSSTASGNYAHAEGYECTASGNRSHAEGSVTNARGEASHAEGLATMASGKYQHVQGQYNVEDSANKYAHIVGNGTSSVACSNAHTLDWNGNAWFAGNIKIGGTGQGDTAAMEVATKNDIISANDYFILKDQFNGHEYVISMQNGSLVSRHTAASIELVQMPTTVEYYEHGYFDPTGMEIYAVLPDGNKVDVTDKITFDSNSLTIDITSICVSYREGNNVYSINIPVTVKEFDAAVVLQDFEYTDNEDGTYTLTGWKDTYNGESSTELIVPNYSCIIV